MLFVLAGLFVAGALARPADPAGAEQQYRVARRLAAQGSPEATSALGKVIELDPAGVLADDALIEQALLLGIPDWPEELGRIEAAAEQAATALLDRVVRELPQHDRAAEAVYRRALLRLEPLPGHDSSAARLELIRVAMAKRPSAWSERARYALGWLHEQLGEHDRALAAFRRVLLDDPLGPTNARAWAGTGRMLLRKGKAARAAQELQNGVDAGASAGILAVGPRELAVGLALRDAVPALRPQALTTPAPTIRTLAGLAPRAEGGVLLGDRKSGRVIALDEQGRAAGEWVLEDLQTIAADPHGRAYAAAGGRLFRLGASGKTQPLAAVEDYAPLEALTADGLGGLWLVDRRGQRVGYVAPGAQRAEQVWEGKTARLAAAAWSGSRLLALDGRSRNLIALDRAGAVTDLVELALERPTAMAVDPAGRVAVLDERAGKIAWVLGDGSRLGVYDCASAGIGRAVALGIGPDGWLHVFDAAAGTWVRQP